MPRNVRNFWLELDVDGRFSSVKTGPVGKDGGFNLRIYIREEGKVVEVGDLIGQYSEIFNDLSLLFRYKGSTEAKVLAQFQR